SCLVSSCDVSCSVLSAPFSGAFFIEPPRGAAVSGSLYMQTTRWRLAIRVACPPCLARLTTTPVTAAQVLDLANRRKRFVILARDTQGECLDILLGDVHLAVS